MCLAIIVFLNVKGVHLKCLLKVIDTRRREQRESLPQVMSKCVFHYVPCLQTRKQNQNIFIYQQDRHSSWEKKCLHVYKMCGHVDIAVLNKAK